VNFDSGEENSDEIPNKWKASVALALLVDESRAEGAFVAIVSHRMGVGWDVT
jgi:hypothetical protein